MRGGRVRSRGCGDGHRGKSGDRAQEQKDAL